MLVITLLLGSDAMNGMMRRTTTNLVKQQSKYGMSSIFAPAKPVYSADTSSMYQPFVPSNTVVASSGQELYLVQGAMPRYQSYMTPIISNQERNYNWTYDLRDFYKFLLKGVAVGTLIMSVPEIVRETIKYYSKIPGTLSYTVQSYLDNRDWNGLDGLLNRTYIDLFEKVQQASMSSMMLDSKIQRAMEMGAVVSPLLQHLYTISVVVVLGGDSSANEEVRIYVAYAFNKMQRKIEKITNKRLLSEDPLISRTRVADACKVQDPEMLSFYLQQSQSLDSKDKAEIIFRSLIPMLYDDKFKENERTFPDLQSDKTLTSKQQEVLNLLLNYQKIMPIVKDASEDAIFKLNKVAHDLHVVLDKVENDRLQQKADQFFQHYIK